MVDFRQVHTVPVTVLQTLCQAGHRTASIEPLFREHLAKHFADTFSRIGLPLPYETEQLGRIDGANVAARSRSTQPWSDALTATTAQFPDSSSMSFRCIRTRKENPV